MIQSGHPRAVKISDVSHTKKYRCISTSRLIFRVFLSFTLSPIIILSSIPLLIQLVHDIDDGEAAVVAPHRFLSSASLEARAPVACPPLTYASSSCSHRERFEAMIAER